MTREEWITQAEAVLRLVVAGDAPGLRGSARRLLEAKVSDGWEAAPWGIPRVVAVVSARMGIRVEELRSASRARKVAHGRHACWWVARTLIPTVTLGELGKELGGRDHTSVLYGLQKMERLVREDPSVEKLVGECLADLQAKTGRAEGNGRSPGGRSR